jgi:hypothetical protein
MTYQPLKTKALFPFETSRYVKLAAMQCNIPEDQYFSNLNILQRTTLENVYGHTFLYGPQQEHILSGQARSELLMVTSSGM